MNQTSKLLTPPQFAEAVGLARNTVYDRIAKGDIDSRLIEYGFSPRTSSGFS
jgi:predicted DNA-binding transcriptional regulator AlpA